MENQPPMQHRARIAQAGSALMLTISLIVVLSLQLAVISMVATRGLGEEGTLYGQNTSAKRAAETAINRLYKDIADYLAAGNTLTDADAAYAQGAVSSSVLNASNPDAPGTSDTDSTLVTISAWIAERRGYNFHLVGRAVTGSVDLLSHRWVKIRPCGGAGVLTTIMTDLDNPSGFVVDSTGRVLFGEEVDTTGRVFTWHENTGLSTLIVGENKPTGGGAITVTSDDRFYFGQYDTVSSKVWTWKDDGSGAGILSTIISGGMPKIGYKSMKASPDGGVYFGSDHWAASFWKWKPAAGGAGAGKLSTILTNTPRYVGKYDPVVASDGRVFFQQQDWGQTTNRVWTWFDDGSGAGILTTIRSDLDTPSGIIIAPDGRAFFGETKTGGRYFSYKAGVSAPGGEEIINAAMNIISPGNSWERAVADDGRLFLASQDGDRCWTWIAGGSLSTLMSSGGGGCHHGVRVHPSTGRAYFGGWADKLKTWKDNGTGAGILSTIIPQSSVGVEQDLYFGPDGEIYTSRVSATSPFWRWEDNGTGAGILSTIIPSANSPGRKNAFGVTDEGRIFIGEQTSSNSRFWTWKPGVGLSTLVDNGAGAIKRVTVAPDGRVFFTEGVSNDARLWTWKEGSCELLF